MKQRVSMGNGAQAIVITNLKFDEDGFVIDQKAGIVAIDPGRDTSEMLEKAGQWEWELHGAKNIQGFFSARKKRKLTDEELSKQEISLNGRSVTNDVVDTEVSASNIADLIERETNTPSRINQPALLSK